MKLFHQTSLAFQPEDIRQDEAMWIMNASLETGVPISFGVLTTYTEEQALVRSRNDAENKGREASAACLESAQILAKISTL